jgi:hypothetical protein
MLWKLSRVEARRSGAMASLAYPIAKTHPLSDDIDHDHVPVMVITVAEYAETLRLSHPDFGCAWCDDATPLAVTLGPTQCGVWLEGEVLLDTPRRSADEMIEAFDLSDAWLWDWEQHVTGSDPSDESVLRAPHVVREV